MDIVWQIVITLVVIASSVVIAIPLAWQRRPGDLLFLSFVSVTLIVVIWR